MGDRELLELAAKSVGYKYIAHHLGRDSFVVYKEECYSEVHERCVTSEKTLSWNPLADDGDALRLAVKLGMTVCIDYAKLKVSVWDGMSKWGSVSLSSDGININKDPYAATRRAIVRAAAEIGRAMK